ncbi:MAG: peptidylprolyl isomerase [Acidobacteriota bacterium]|nr:peptidylprolyl isomerase [Acidobacteriota bacterium]
MTLLLLMTLLFQDRTTSVFVDRIAIKVNDKMMTEQELVNLYQDIRKQALQEASGADLDAKLKEAWDAAVSEAEQTLLLYEKAVESGVAFSREETISLLAGMREQAGLSEAEFEEEVKRQTNLTMDELVDKRMREDSARAAIQSLVLNKITFEDNEIAKYYDENKKDYMVPASYRIAEIVFRKDVGTPAEIQERISKCRADLAGGMDFGEAAKVHSDSFSKENGGDLGTVNYGDLLKEIEDMVKKLDVGQVSDTLETEGSFFILKILEKTDATPKPLDSVREQIVNAMRAPRMEKAVDEFLKKLRQEFVVETYVKTLPEYLEH